MSTETKPNVPAIIAAIEAALAPAIDAGNNAGKLQLVAMARIADAGATFRPNDTGDKSPARESVVLGYLHAEKLADTPENRKTRAAKISNAWNAFKVGAAGLWDATKATADAFTADKGGRAIENLETAIRFAKDVGRAPTLDDLNATKPNDPDAETLHTLKRCAKALRKIGRVAIADACSLEAINLNATIERRKHAAAGLSPVPQVAAVAAAPVPVETPKTAAVFDLSKFLALPKPQQDAVVAALGFNPAEGASVEVSTPTLTSKPPRPRTRR